MIHTSDCIYVDSCDPHFTKLCDFEYWLRLMRDTGLDLNRVVCGGYLVVVSNHDYPNYQDIRSRLERRLNASNQVSVPDLDWHLAPGTG